MLLTKRSPHHRAHWTATDQQRSGLQWEGPLAPGPNLREAVPTRAPHCLRTCASHLLFLPVTQATWRPSWAEGDRCQGSVRGTHSSGHRQSGRR